MTVLEENAGEHIILRWGKPSKHAIKGRDNKSKGLLELTTQ